MSKKVSIIVAEHQAIFRTVLANYLNSQFEFEVRAQVSNGKELMNELKTQTPDVILMELKMPVMDGHETLTMIRNRYPDQKVIIFSLQDSAESINQIQNHGANGFVSKLDPVEVLSNTIKAVHTKGFFLHKKLQQAKRDHTLNTIKKELLSEKEISVVKEVCNGLSNIQISKRLFISCSTVDFHRQNIYKKTGSRNAIDVMRYALKNKLFSVESI